jgi:hypothetical protein
MNCTEKPRPGQLNAISFKLLGVRTCWDARLWAEVLNLGGYDLLAKRFDASEVNRAVDSALRNWMWLKAVQAGQEAN